MKKNMDKKVIIIILFSIFYIFAEKEVLIFQQGLNSYNGVTDTYR